MDYRYVLTASISSILGAFLGYLITYTNEKAKNKALKEDIAKITTEKEAIVAEFNLDQVKRKHKFERKHLVYSQYLSLLDKFDSEKNPLLDNQKLEELASELTNSLRSNNDEGIKMKAINEFGNTINNMIRSSLEGLKNIALETNELRLVATDEILVILDKLKMNYEKIEKVSDTIFKNPLDVVTGNNDFQKVNQDVKELSDSTKSMKIQLIALMRNDLDRI